MNVLGVKVNNITSSELTQLLLDSFKKGGKKLKITKVNAEFISRAMHDRPYRKLLNSADLSIVDGRGVLWVARYLILPISRNPLIRRVQAIWQMVYTGASIILYPKLITYPIPEAMPGVEAFGQMMKIANDQGIGVFLFGSPQYILNMTIENLKKSYPKLKISGSLNGYGFCESNGIDPVAEINKTDAKLLIVALGSPKQEQWIKDNIDKLKNVKVAVGEGGTFTRIANPRQQAPKFINRLGLEWLWRLLFNMSETTGRNRLQRFWRAVPLFIYRSVKWKIKYGQSEI